MKKIGLIILVVTSVFTAVIGLPKFERARNLKDEYTVVSSSLEESERALSDAKADLAGEQDNINSLRSSDVNPYSALEVTSEILSIPGIQNYTFDAYNSTELNGDVLLRTFTSEDELTFSSDINLITYKLQVSNPAEFLTTLESYQLNVTNVIVHDQNQVQFSVRFIGGVD